MLLVLLSPRSSSEQFGAGARPVHPILGHGPNWLVDGIARPATGFISRKTMMQWSGKFD
jgi:hypothetical protein